MEMVVKGLEYRHKSIVEVYEAITEVARRVGMKRVVESSVEDGRRGRLRLRGGRGRGREGRVKVMVVTSL